MKCRIATIPPVFVAQLSQTLKRKVRFDTEH